MHHPTVKQLKEMQLAQHMDIADPQATSSSNTQSTVGLELEDLSDNSSDISVEVWSM